MEQYNWIKAVFTTKESLAEKEVLVRQEFAGSEEFVDGAGNRFHISELDLTRNTFEPQLFNLEEFEKRNKELDTQFKANQEIMNKMLSSLDANAIADHKAKIDEREYWRKLRGDIALEIIRKRGDKEHYNSPSGYGTIANMAKFLFDELYNQDKEFFKYVDNG